MQKRSWPRRLVMAAIWALAVSTWASIAHHLMGLPDVGPLLVVVAFAGVLGGCKEEFSDDPFGVLDISSTLSSPRCSAPFRRLC